MHRYLAHTARLAAATPPERNRVVDFWRVAAILVVAVGHWLAASIWLQANDEVALLNSLDWVPYAAWVTWLVQVMPVFFLCGGYANSRSMRAVAAGEQARRDWITLRTRRLFTPVIPVLLVWVVLILAMRPFVPADIVYAAAMSATVPIWFLAVYLTLTALAPFTHAWWRRHGPWSVAALASISIGIDLARFAFNVPGIGWANFAFTWAFVHQVGYWWADRDAAGIRPSRGWLLAAGALAALLGVTWDGWWYPVAMLGIPGQGVANMVPPTFAIAMLGIVQLGLMIGTAPALRRFLGRRRPWHTTVSLAGVAMTVYLWHLSAMSLVVAGGIFVADGAAFRIEPGTGTWWATRPVWIVVLGTVTLLLVVLFARFEWRVSDAPLPATRTRVLVGVLLIAGSAAAVARIGLATEDAVVEWSIPIAAIAGATLLGALPSFRWRK